MRKTGERFRFVHLAVAEHAPHAPSTDIGEASVAELRMNLATGTGIEPSGLLDQESLHGREAHLALVAAARRGVGEARGSPVPIPVEQDPDGTRGPESAVGLAIRHHPQRLARRPMKLGFVGLGVGTLAAYAAPGDSVRFYEINPDVVALSAGPAPVFIYVRDCPGTVQIALGDARINLEREAPQGFDVLALDAVSSDSIPAHLLTLEAGQLYLRHLGRDGILAIHISNRHLDLDPVVRGLAEALGLVVVRIDDARQGDLVWGSDWMLLARDLSVLAHPEIQRVASPPPSSSDVSLLWTDAYSNLLHVFKG